MAKKSRISTSVQLLSLAMSGEKIIDCTYEAMTLRLQTRADGGVDMVLIGKDDRGGMTHAKCDLAAVISAVSECVASHRFEGISDAVPTVMIRGQIDQTTEELSKVTTTLAAIQQDTARLNREKCEREVEYLDQLRELFEVAASTCNRTLSTFGKRILRGRA
jgi:hypothetical protein